MSCFELEAMGDNVDVATDRNDLHSAISSLQKGSKNKRKYLAELPLDRIDVSSLSLTEFPRYEFLEEKLRDINKVGIEALVSGAGVHFHEEEVDDFEDEEWDDMVVCQLQELLTQNLLETFRSAIKKLVESGHDKDDAEKLILRSGLYHGTKDVVSNAVEGALAFLAREKELEISWRHVFEDLDSLVNYTIVEMIAVVREVKPFLTVAEAMWWLLIGDLSLLHVCLVDRDQLGSLTIPDFSAESSTDPADSSSKMDDFSSSMEALEPNDEIPSKPPTSRQPVSAIRDYPPALNTLANSDHGKESFYLSSESCVKFPIASQDPLEDKGCCPHRKGSTGNSKRDMLRQKTFHFEKSYRGRMSRGAFKAKLASWGSMVYDKTLKSASGSSSVVMKSTYSKVTASVCTDGSHSEGAVLSNSTQGDSVLSIKETVVALPAANKKISVPESKSDTKSQDNNTSSSEAPDYYAGIPYDESLGKYVPVDEKDETIMILVPHMKALQKEIEVWKDWALEKIMQATKRLGKDAAELKMLRQEKEEADKFQKEMPVLEEGSMKRLSEMESAISNATTQIETADMCILKFEKENSLLKLEAEAARLEALRATANLAEIMFKEQEALKRCQMGDTGTFELQEELATVKQGVANFQQQLEKAETQKNQIEALLKQERREKSKHQRQAALLRKETEQLKAQIKVDEANMREADERNERQCIEDIKRLEKEISDLVLESSRMAELLRGANVGHSNLQQPKANKRLAVFQDNFGAGKLRPERECVMCLTEEMSVVFLPCAHQVLCAECNALHEKQGMSDCPSCRTPIKKRITVRYIDSGH